MQEEAGLRAEALDQWQEMTRRQVRVGGWQVTRMAQLLRAWREPCDRPQESVFSLVFCICEGQEEHNSFGDWGMLSSASGWFQLRPEGEGCVPDRSAEACCFPEGLW